MPQLVDTRSFAGLRLVRVRLPVILVLAVAGVAAIIAVAPSKASAQIPAWYGTSYGYGAGYGLGYGVVYADGVPFPAQNPGVNFALDSEPVDSTCSSYDSWCSYCTANPHARACAKDPPSEPQSNQSP
jgi:hypothetical protein